MILFVLERGLGRIGRGNIRGVLLNAALTLDAEDGGCLGLVTGKVWTSTDEVKAPHRQRAFTDRESAIWLETAEAAKPALARAHGHHRRRPRTRHLRGMGAPAGGQRPSSDPRQQEPAHDRR